MTITFGFTDELTNTRHAPLAALSAHYQQQQLLAPLAQMQIPMRIREFSPADKLLQVLVSILAGCATLSEVNTTLKTEPGLAALWGWPRFADQSSLSRQLDALTLTQIDQLRHATTAIWSAHSQTQRHDWRGFLWLDFDLSGLPCSPRAEASQKATSATKKRHWAAIGRTDEAIPRVPGCTVRQPRRYRSVPRPGLGSWRTRPHRRGDSGVPSGAAHQPQRCRSTLLPGRGLRATRPHR